MRSFFHSAARRFGPTGLMMLSVLCVAIPAARAQRFEGPRYDRRGFHTPVEETTRHLEVLANRSGAFNSRRERSRYDHALRHLSRFQASYERGRFDKGKLNEAINDVQNVVNKNPLDDRARKMLWGDLNNLRAFRATRSGDWQFGFQQ